VGVRLGPTEDSLRETHEINVTPFIDVMLVLLIVFMVAAPLATVDVDVDLPVSTAAPRPHPDLPITLSVRADGTLALGSEEIDRGSLGAALESAAGGDRERRIFLRGDRALEYGELMNVMNELRAVGFLKLALVGLEGEPAP
jgi:biopolymer transport protein ExbD